MQVAGERCRYDYIVGADGQSSRVRSWAGLAQGSLWSRRFGLRRHYRIAPWNEMVEVPLGRFGAGLCDAGGSRRGLVSRLSPVSSFARMDAVLASMPTLRRRLEHAAVLSTVRGALTTTRRLRRVCAEGVALVGDASGGSRNRSHRPGNCIVLSSSRVACTGGEGRRPHAIRGGTYRDLRLSQSMARWMLCMDRFPWLRDRTIAAFSREPEIFATCSRRTRGRSRLADSCYGAARISHGRCCCHPATTRCVIPA